MNMESSHRSIDRSRESGSLKKSRLTEESDRSIPFQPRLFTGNGSTGSLLSRIRATKDREKDDEREDSVRSPNKKQNHELFSQYKTALGELTFNSKPIITNLTIIAGENLHAAKGIAAVVCANILEVPSEQKLPSLYLLDSIVKNIGRDYIKYFAAKLPEVFCKAYRQVDSSMHTGMRHLFGTWKGVFPPPALQIIEKELGFRPTANGSSSGATTAKSDSQSQHLPPHSIHVNPKYLEARQLLQQSNRAKGIASNRGSTVISAENAERPDRSAISGRTRSSMDPPVKMHKTQHHQREQLNEPVRENPGAGYGDYKFMSDLPSQPDFEIGRAHERVTERGFDKTLYESDNAADEALGQRNGFENTHIGMGRASKRAADRQLDELSESGNAADKAISKRNGFENAHAYGNHQTVGSAPTVTRVQPAQGIANSSGRGTSRNWKHFEEEEYMWDDMNSRLTDHGGANSSREDGRISSNAERPLSLQREKLVPLESEFTETRWNTLETLSRSKKPSEAEDRVPLEREFGDGLQQARNQHNTGSRFNSEASTDSLSIKQGGQTTFGHRTPSVWSFQEPRSANGLNQSSTQYEGPISPGNSSLSKSTSFSVAKTGLLPPIVGPADRAFHSLNAPDHIHQFNPQSNQKPPQISGLLNRTQHMQVTKDSLPLVPQNHVQPIMLRNLPFTPSQPPQHLHNSLPSVIPSNQLTPHLPFFQQPQTDLSLQQTQSQPSGLGHFNSGSSLDAIMKSVLATNNSVTNNFKKSNHLDTAMASHLNIQPPLPNGPPPTNLVTPSVPIVPSASASCATSLSDVSAPVAHAPREILPPLPPGLPQPSFLDGDTSSQLPKKGITISNLLSSLVAQGLISSTSTEAPTVATDASFSLDRIPPSEPTKRGSNSSQTRTTEMKDLIGIEFKPESIRQFHPLVINALFDDLPHQCSMCGLRHKHQEMLGEHLDWHASKKHVQTSYSNISRKWYPTLSDWVDGNVGPPSSMEKSASVSERHEPMVPADDVHIICALCGEPFEDCYSEERDEWMYKGAVYITTLTSKVDIESADECCQQGPIAHAKCISESSMYDVEVS